MVLRRPGDDRRGLGCQGSWGWVNDLGWFVQFDIVYSKYLLLDLHGGYSTSSCFDPDLPICDVCRNVMSDWWFTKLAGQVVALI